MMHLRPLSRRKFLLAAGGVLAGLGLPAIDAFAWAPRRVELSRYDVPVAGLPAELDGLRLAQVSDVHLYDGLHAAARRTIELLAAEHPDLILFTGDMCEHARQLPVLQEMLRACPARLGRIAVMGNWEWQSHIYPPIFARACDAGDTELLLNSSRVFRIGGATLAIAGLDDPRAGLPDPERALAGIPDGATTLLTFHAPGYADLLLGSNLPRPALVLAGHTHGGQIRPPFLPAITPPMSGRFVGGWYYDSFAPMLVSRGVGTSGIRARFRCPPEIPLLTLRRT